MLLYCSLAPPASFLSLVPPHVALHGVGWGTLLGTVSSKCLFCGTCLPEWTAGSLMYRTEAPLCSAVARVLLLPSNRGQSQEMPRQESKQCHLTPRPCTHGLHLPDTPAWKSLCTITAVVTLYPQTCYFLLSPRPSLFWPPPGSRPSWRALPRKCWRRASSHPTLSLFSIFFPSQQSAKAPRGQGCLCNLCHCTSSKPGTR